MDCNLSTYFGPEANKDFRKVVGGEQKAVAFNKLSAITLLMHEASLVTCSSWINFKYLMPAAIDIALRANNAFCSLLQEKPEWIS